MKYPAAIWKPVTNHGGQITRIQGLVLHVQEGNNSLQGWFSNPASQASSHFWVSKTGVMEQYVDTNVVAWAQAAGNPYYLSIETEGFQGEALTQAQINGLASLLVWMNTTFQTPLFGPVAHGAWGFTQHCNLNGTPDPAWGGHVCPGSIRMGQMPAIITKARGSQSVLNKPACAIIGTATDKGYWIFAQDGGVFAYGDAKMYGSLPGKGITPAAPIVGAAVTQNDGGYWMVGADGGVFAFGDALFYGSPNK